MSSAWISDEQIGKNLARMRTMAGLSQKQLAELVRAADPERFKWAPATVWNVEDGTRPLRLGEAEVLASILNGDVEELLNAGDSQIPKALYKKLQETKESQEIHELAVRMARKIVAIAIEADELVASGVELSEQDALKVRIVTQRQTPTFAIQSAYNEVSAFYEIEYSDLQPGPFLRDALAQLKAERKALQAVAFNPSL